MNVKRRRTRIDSGTGGITGRRCDDAASMSAAIDLRVFCEPSASARAALNALGWLTPQQAEELRAELRREKCRSAKLRRALDAQPIDAVKAMGIVELVARAEQRASKMHKGPAKVIALLCEQIMSMLPSAAKKG